MKKLIQIEKGFTHAGKFHADDVFSSALLTMLNPEIKIERGFEVPEAFDGIVFDIGMGEFDHHQQERRVRENGIPYAAFGLLWETYGELILSSEESVKFDEKFVQPLDLNDNTGADNMLSDIISVFNPPWDYAVSSDGAFQEAKELAITILKKEFENIKSIKRAEHLVKKAIEKAEEHILILPRSAPWKKYVKETELYFAIFPSNRGGYCAQGIPKDDNTDQLKCAFPKEWRGRVKEELKELTSLETLQFCHNSGFLIATGTQEDAVEACKLAMKHQEELKEQENK
ncbi:MYG1 family protein [Anaeromicropila populeti]|uniref:Uncharacterized protein, UPF0160 family n=1 Tax=Anaeromicropila populeti TaxID=37658 RepID=A0A1I6KLI2_9FIRM|nr:MYG1 family protein [Anaeromicropila populeti]SFR91750.1 Uncharacterized protein, UPF0160 family [Anaeromicropila populeti]